MKNIIVFLIAILILAGSCTSNKIISSQSEPKTIDYSPGPPALVYKTKSDYSQLVPVILSPDKSAIVSFPSPKDLVYKGKPAYPTELKKGYLLDNRGITKDVAFLSITYDEYANLSKTPSAKDLFEQILDDAPLLKLYNCGNRRQYNDIVAELNSIIRNGELENCNCLAGK
jgi:hypothetical protein